jgi:peptide deformylase
MKPLPLVLTPDNRLRQKSKPIDRVDEKLLHFMQELAHTLLKKTDPPGVGLSAIQVGEPLRLFATYMPHDLDIPLKKWSASNQEIVFMINPEIKAVSPGGKTLGGTSEKPYYEGCLSIPKLYGPVYRYYGLSLEYQTFDFSLESTHVPTLTKKTTKFFDFPARVIQHELDHLDGILFTDHTLKDALPLYFDTPDGLEPIDNPNSVITW